MAYITTKVQALKSYPTYQFYATAESKSCSTDDVFMICILESLQWIRSRLQGFNDLPQEINTPDPEQYAAFSDKGLASFSYNNGFQIDVIYIDTLSVWSFRMTEPDMGANLGTPRERLAVNGRSFTTEIAFRKQSDCVEIGIRTICSEPVDIVASCEVFRPRVVKALAENTNMHLNHHSWKINGKPLEVKSKNDLEHFLSIFTDSERSMPIVLIADSSTEIQQPQPSILPSITLSLSIDRYSLSGFTRHDKELNITINAEECGIKNNFALHNNKLQKSKSNKALPTMQATAIKTKLAVFDYSELAQALLGFAIVAFVDESYFRQIDNKAQISIDYGDILVISRQQSTEMFSYDQY